MKLNASISGSELPIDSRTGLVSSILISLKLIKNSLDEEIKEALDNLHVDLRSVLWLSDIEGFTYQEIGEMLECPMGTIASRLYRARSLLREALWEYAKKRGVIKE
jgi:RNA polymerase sigma-70 factor (ECF subfamily)